MEAKVEWGKLNATFVMGRDEVMYIMLGIIAAVMGGMGFSAIIGAIR